MKALAAMTLGALLAACTGGPSDLDCSEGKCDVPDDVSHKKQCENSRVSAMDERRPHFTPAGARWSCRDVNGVTANSDTSDDRGQEYCEYFTLLHTDGIPEVIMNEQGPVFCDSSTPCATGVCNESIFSCVSSNTVDRSQKAEVIGKNTPGESPQGNPVLPLDPKLNAGQLEWLSQNPAEKVGECVFTAWHQDNTKLPVSQELVAGHKLDARIPGFTEKLFRMQVGFNSNAAAKGLVEACLGEGDAKHKDGFMRGCMFCDGQSCIPWRKSDPSVCTVAMRIAECGCTVEAADSTGKFRALDLTKAADLKKATQLFVPTSRRGFTLGTWDGMDQLPSGCRYVKMGDSPTIDINGVKFNDPHADQILVTCDLKGSHITAATAKDPKEACRQTYGEEVVVHVRAPDPSVARLKCDTAKPNCEGTPWDFGNL